MATKLKTGAEEPTLRSRRQRKPKRELGHGNWKLVYADFVTVLMAFFLVCWILLYNLLSEIEPVDNACIKQMAEELNRQIDNDNKLKRGAIPIQIDLEPLGLRLTLLDNSQPMFQSGGTTLSPLWVSPTAFSSPWVIVAFCPGSIQHDCHRGQHVPAKQVAYRGLHRRHPLCGGCHGLW